MRVDSSHFLSFSSLLAFPLYASNEICTTLKSGLLTSQPPSMTSVTLRPHARQYASTAAPSSICA